MHQPWGFYRHLGYVLKLNRTLYGLKQAPRYFFKHLPERIIEAGCKPSDHDPCLFLSSDVVVICYVDDLLVYGRTDDAINVFIQQMAIQDVKLRREGTAEGFLGVDIKRDGNKTVLTQSGLAKCVVEALGLCTKYTNSLSTPAECGALPCDPSGTPYTGPISYSSVVGMLLYLTGHSRPDCSFAVHQCARYTFEPKFSHITALSRISKYIKGTLDKGLILDPSDELSLECCPDADLAGLWGR